MRDVNQKETKSADLAKAMKMVDLKLPGHPGEWMDQIVML
jgi:hypothetical protein